MAVYIPLRSDLTYFSLLVPLDGVNYTLQFRWNLRENAWYMDVLNEAGDTVLIGGIAIVVSYPLASQFTGRSPPGIFAATDTTGENVDPGINDLGDRVKLFYVTAAELAAVGQ